MWERFPPLILEGSYDAAFAAGVFEANLNRSSFGIAGAGRCPPSSDSGYKNRGGYRKRPVKVSPTTSLSKRRVAMSGLEPPTHGL